MFFILFIAALPFARWQLFAPDDTSDGSDTAQAILGAILKISGVSDTGC